MTKRKNDGPELSTLSVHEPPKREANKRSKGSEGFGFKCGGVESRLYNAWHGRRLTLNLKPLTNPV